MGKGKKTSSAALPTCVGLLRKRLALIEARMMELLDCSTVEVVEEDHSRDFVFLGYPKHYWGNPDEKQLRLQMEIKGLYSSWFEQFQLLLSDATEALAGSTEETHSAVRRWIEKQPSHDISVNLDKNKQRFRDWLEEFRQVLLAFDDPTRSKVVVVPDTNCLTGCPDIEKYASIAGGVTYDFVLLPTVLGELDELKVRARDETYRKKVESAIRRIKGWRTQGPLGEGVTVNGTVTVRSIAREPDFAKTLKWLDRDNRDDRIIASVLELQRAMPSAAIVLVTGDINLQNKADAASLPYAEAPASPATPKPWEGVVLAEAGAQQYFDWGRRMLAVALEDSPLRMAPNLQQEICERLWQRDDVSPEFGLGSNEPRHWVYLTDPGRSWKRKLQSHSGDQYLIAAPRREPPPPKCPECGKRSGRGAAFCSGCMKVGKTIHL